MRSNTHSRQLLQFTNKFIPHSSLSYNSTTNTEYLQNDCVRLRVSKVILYSTALLNKTPSWQNPHNGYQSLHEFTLTEYSKRKQFGNDHTSSSFYTYLRGYKFCIAVRSNGYNSGKNSHISVYIYQMAGEYDDQLEWPFVGKFDINWREDKRHHSSTVPIGAGSGFVNLTARLFGSSQGIHNFIPHSSLAYDPLRKVEYLQEDCLRFRVSLNTN